MSISGHGGVVTVDMSGHGGMVSVDMGEWRVSVESGDYQ